VRGSCFGARTAPIRRYTFDVPREEVVVKYLLGVMVLMIATGHALPAAAADAAANERCREAFRLIVERVPELKKDPQNHDCAVNARSIRYWNCAVDKLTADRTANPFAVLSSCEKEDRT
jgi:hypothetical protein